MEFKNEPPLDFTIKTNREAFQGAINTVYNEITKGRYSAPIIINGQVIRTEKTLQSINPSDGKTVIGNVSLADTDRVESAIESLTDGKSDWAAFLPKERASVLLKTADIMTEKRLELAALICFEAGKPWKEADADVIEAIDFCRYYALEVERIVKDRILLEVAGEQNIYTYLPRGLGVVISPWNFPLAIPCGMTVASLVCGNTTILKPAEQTSIIAHAFSKILLEAGVPKNAYAFLPGVGEEIGSYLVDHKNVDLICFTGSKAVGLDIIKRAGIVREGQRNVKKVIAEMGGKNAIIVDEDADLDEAINGTLYSAFGFAGQKCSAGSRVICVGDSYEPFLARLKQAAGDITVGAATEPATYLGPVIDSEAQQRLLTAIATSKSTPLFKGKVPKEGYFVPATVFRDVQKNADIWQNELFGPVLACTHVATFKEAVTLALDSEYALTGGLFSRSPSNIEYAYRNFTVGNLYINRSITGAIVLRQPFGGSRMSGVGSKAGGPDYLLQFLTPRTITENTMRRGFTPELL